MAHIDNPREEFSSSTGIGIPLLIMMTFYIANIAMVVFALMAFFSFRTDYKNQRELLFSVVKNESTPLSEAVTQKDGAYTVDYGKLGEEHESYFNKDELEKMKSDGKQTKQEFLVSVLENDKAYSPIRAKTTTLAVISVVLLAFLLFRSLRQIRALW